MRGRDDSARFVDERFAATELKINQRTVAYLADRELVELSPDSTYSVPDVFLRAWIIRRMAPPSIF